MSFTLPKLEYAYNALEPALDAKTLEIHHTKHHQSYITKLNAALEKAPEWQGKSLEVLLTSFAALPEAIRKDVRNMGGGHYNHALFWKSLTPNSTGKPEGKLAQAIDSQFGSLDAFKEAFNQVATNHFSAGWAWLCVDKNEKLVIKSTPDHDCPLTDGMYPVYVLDVWEHAYYLKYQNLRADFVKASWSVVNWKYISSRYAERSPLSLA